MTAMPAPRHDPAMPDHPLTVTEYAALGETRTGYTELIEGHLLKSPSPTPKHARASGRLYMQLTEQVPEHVEVFQDIDIDLQLVPAREPGFSRRPDLVVVDRTAPERVEREGGMLRAAEVLVVCEIVSPGSRRIDNVDKRGEYADAGIPLYWIVDLNGPVSLTECRLTAKHGYRNQQRATDSFATTRPFPIKVDLNRLS